MKIRDTVEDIKCVGRRRIAVSLSDEPAGLVLVIDLDRTTGRTNLANLVLEKREAKKLAATINRTIKLV